MIKDINYVGAVRTWGGRDIFYEKKEDYFNAIGDDTVKIAISCTNRSRDSLARQLNMEDISI
jgi:hypothetical protein